MKAKPSGHTVTAFEHSPEQLDTQVYAQFSKSPKAYLAPFFKSFGVTTGKAITITATSLE
jgi:hypothetical protein